LLIKGGIVDVEGILEVDFQKLATIVGSADAAKQLTELARRLLGSATAPEPVRVKVRTVLNAIDVDATLRKQLEDAGIRDVEGVIEAGSAKLVEAVGDRATATKLTQSARKVVGTAPADGTKPIRRKTAPKKPK
jgi:hypothetical protein